MLALILSLTILAAATSSTSAAPTSSTLSCHDDICTDGPHVFSCWQRRLVCCKGRANNSFQVFTQRRGFECCSGAGKLFETQREICVSGQVRLRGQNEEICGPDKTYNISNQVCCGGNVFSKIAEAQCCGNEYLTDDTQSCCNGMKYNTDEQVCCHRLENDPALGSHQLFDFPDGGCCLDKPYYRRNQSCIKTDSGYRLVNKSGEGQMCSNEYYDPTTHGCCRGASTTVYKRRRMLCHRGVLYKKTNPHQNSVCIYNYDDDQGRRQERVIPYTKNSRTGCISSTGVVSLGPLEDICGDQIYNISTDLCCSGKRYADMKIAGFQCCISGGTKMFHPASEICCLNQVSNRFVYNNGGRCCYNEPYSTTTHECRGGKPTPKACSSYGNKCNVSVSVLKRMKKRYVYFGIAGKMTEDTSSRRRAPSRQWTISDLKTLKFKKGKVTVVKTKSKGTHFLKSTKCGCPQNLAAGARYMFVSSQPVRRKTLLLESADNGFIISIEDKQQIGLVFETIIEKSK